IAPHIEHGDLALLNVGRGSPSYRMSPKWWSYTALPNWIPNTFSLPSYRTMGLVSRDANRIYRLTRNLAKPAMENWLMKYNQLIELIRKYFLKESGGKINLTEQDVLLNMVHPNGPHAELFKIPEAETSEEARVLKDAGVDRGEVALAGNAELT